MNKLLQFLAMGLGGIVGSYDQQTVDALKLVLSGEPKLAATATPDAADDSDRLPTTAWVRDLIAELATPPGAIMWWAKAAPPAGWLKCNGALLNRGAYAALFNSIGVTHGAGDGTTTFALPDLRGEFIRGLSDGRVGIDTGRTLGSAQADMFQTHTHNITGWSSTVNETPGAHFYNTNQFNTTASTTAPLGGNSGSETRPRNIALLPIIKY